MWSDQIDESQPRLRKAGLPFLFSTFPPFRGNSRAMTLDIKICGLKTEDALAAALSGGGPEKRVLMIAPSQMQYYPGQG